MMPAVRIVIVGCGRVGASIALRTLAEGHDVGIVDINRAAFGRLGEDFPGLMVLGNGLEEETLRRAGAEGADAFASLTPGDNRNLMMAQIAREVFAIDRVITRVYDPVRAEIYRALGVETFCSTLIGAGIVHDYWTTGRNRGHQLAGTRE